MNSFLSPSTAAGLRPGECFALLVSFPLTPTGPTYTAVEQATAADLARGGFGPDQIERAVLKTREITARRESADAANTARLATGKATREAQQTALLHQYASLPLGSVERMAFFTEHTAAIWQAYRSQPAAKR